MSDESYQDEIYHGGIQDEPDNSPTTYEADLSTIIHLLSEKEDVSDLDFPLIWKPLQDRIHSLCANSTGSPSEKIASGSIFENSIYPLAIQSQKKIETSNIHFQRLFGVRNKKTPDTVSNEFDHHGDVYIASDDSEWILSIFPLFDGQKTYQLLAFRPKNTVPDGMDTVFFVLPVPALLLNKNGIIIKANPAFLAISGKKTGELIYHDLASVNFNDTIRQQVETVVLTRIPYTTTVMYTGNDGIASLKQVYLAPISVLPGQVDNVLLILDRENIQISDQDILTSKEPEYKKIQDKYLTLISGLPLAMAEIDGLGTVCKVNNFFADIFGVSSDSLLSTQMNMLLPDLISETNPHQLCGVETCVIREGEIFSPGYHGIIEARALRIHSADESECCMYLLLIKKPYEKVSPVLSSETDVTGITDQIYQLCIRNAQVPMAFMTSDGMISHMNELFKSLIGMDLGDDTGISAQECGFLPEIVSKGENMPDTGAVTWYNFSYGSCTGTNGRVDVVYIPFSQRMKPAYGIIIAVPSKDNETCIPYSETESSPVFSLSDTKEIWLNQFIASYPAPALICGHDGIIRYSNTEFADCIGVHVDTIKGLRLDDCITSNEETNNPSFVGSHIHPRFSKVSIHCQEKTRLFYQYVVSVAFDDSPCDFILYSDITNESDTIRSQTEEITALQKHIVVLNEKVVSIHHMIDTVADSADDLDSGSHEILEFIIHDSWFAIDVAMVREIVEMVAITPLPKTPSYICGVINLRGEITTIIDLSTLIGSSSHKSRDEQKIIILSSDKTERVNLGLIVDEVHSVQQIGKGQLNKLGDDITAHTSTGIKGIIRIRSDDRQDGRESAEGATRLVIWLRMEQIIDEIRLHS